MAVNNKIDQGIMKPASKKQIGYLKGLAKKAGHDIDSDELEGLTSSEASAMIKTLVDQGMDERQQAVNTMKNKIMSMAHTIGWESSNGKVNIHRINEWCKKYGKFHKPLDDHAYEELPALVSQFQQGPFSSHLTKVKHA